MKFIVRLGAKILGTLHFDNKFHHFDGDDAFKILLADMIRAGKPATSDPQFPFRLLDEIRGRGYGTEELLIEIEEQFTKFMSLIPHDTALYRDSTQQWALMSLLEKTYLLDILQKDKMFSGSM